MISQRWETDQKEILRNNAIFSKSFLDSDDLVVYFVVNFVRMVVFVNILNLLVNRANRGSFQIASTQHVSYMYHTEQYMNFISNLLFHFSVWHAWKSPPMKPKHSDIICECKPQMGNTICPNEGPHHSLFHTSPHDSSWKRRLSWPCLLPRQS